MSNMKCPFCQQAIMCMDAQDADEHSTWYCPRCIAERAWYAFGNETLWQELIRTRKALDIAVERLGYIKNNYKSWTPDRDAQMIAQAANGLDEIKTALEQKDK